MQQQEAKKFTELVILLNKKHTFPVKLYFKELEKILSSIDGIEVKELLSVVIFWELGDFGFDISSACTCSISSLSTT